MTSSFKTILVALIFMMIKSVLNILFDKEIWEKIISDFEEKHILKKEKISAYKNIVESNKYIDIAQLVNNKNYNFEYPLKKTLNKIQTGKKKIVYIFNYQDDLLIKVINRILNEKFSDEISPVCHSFQKNKSAKTAFKQILKDKNIDQKFNYKSDISNYFNSININNLIETLPEKIKKDQVLFHTLKKLLENPYSVNEKAEILAENKGIMAGCATATFFANIYLKKLDDYFVENKINYVRYSDDITVFDTKEKIYEHKEYIENFLKEKGLSINQSKTKIYSPDESKIFLGFEYFNRKIDISPISVLKIKGKIKRISASIQRKIVRKKINENDALKIFITKMNKKFYGRTFENNELCFARWYFPIINSSERLKIIDIYFAERLRFSITGRNRKKNYSVVPYSKLQKNGYIPLVNSFYSFKKNNINFKFK